MSSSLLKGFSTRPTPTRGPYRPASEARVVDELAKLLPACFEGSAKRMSLRREVGAGRAIVDLVAVLTGKGKSPREALSVRESVVLASLRQNGPTRVDLLERRCGVAQGDLRNETIAGLEERSLLRRDRGGRVSLTRAWPARIAIIAFEAKLLRWRDAVRQAVVYKRFADESYVVLPESNARPALESRGHFEQSGVGLLVVTGTGFYVAVEPIRVDKHDWRREFIWSRVPD